MTWTLIPVSAVYGLVVALVFRRFMNRASMRRTANRMIAHAMELRLFLDSPLLVLHAQRDLLRENLRLLRLTLLPCAIMALIFAVLFPQWDAMYGYAPLRPGERTVITVRGSEDAVLETPAGVEIETPAVHAIHDHQISWRVRALGQTSGELRVRETGRIVTRHIVAGNGLIYGMRLPFSKPAIEIRYPRRTILGTNWMVWFFVVSCAAAIGYRR
jgi:hypothetical protein